MSCECGECLERFTFNLLSSLVKDGIIDPLTAEVAWNELTGETNDN